jgi:hypothetical protein
MTTGWLAAAVVIAALAAVATGVCMVTLGRMRRLLEQQQILGEQLQLVDDAVRGMESRLDAVSAGPRATEGAAGQAESEFEGEGMRGESIDAEIAPEIQAAIAAAAVVAAGDKARVRSMRQVKAQQDGSAWSKQGRVLVQTSHNVRPSR